VKFWIYADTPLQKHYKSVNRSGDLLCLSLQPCRNTFRVCSLEIAYVSIVDTLQNCNLHGC